MALKTVIPFQIFAPPNPVSTAPRTTEVRFSRWNNANADKYQRQQRTQQEIEDDLRRYRRFESALNIANIPNSDTTTTANKAETSENQNSYFKSTGTPSTPSLPSIPGKKSKYSRNPNLKSDNPHPAFQKWTRKSKLPVDENQVRQPNVKIAEDGVSYVVDGAPFEYMYSYTETPKIKPIVLREPPIAPFGPDTMPRPWTGRKPLPPSKKKLPEFDSFVLPPANKKGVKPVQKPGPYLPGSGPKYVRSREEILGESLTKEEVKELIEGCMKTKRQLNIGRDGLTHNMLDNIHAHWKRRRVCKIKCKGVCTVDMDNVCEQLEDKTGGKIIHRKGGVLYLFRGRNYNYKSRPRIPLMLWKPATPVYPRLVKRAPEGLTLEEATEMRRRGRSLIPICKLAKNGVYINLVKHVREAFEACELVRINCQGMQGSDYHKIGAKLKELVPCVLISFEDEHILIWRGRDWKSSFTKFEDDSVGAEDNKTDDMAAANSYSVISSPSKGEELLASCLPEVYQAINDGHDTCIGSTLDADAGVLQNEVSISDFHEVPIQGTSVETSLLSTVWFNLRRVGMEAKPYTILMILLMATPKFSVIFQALKPYLIMLSRLKIARETAPYENADVVYERSVAFAQIAAPGPVFRHAPRKAAVQKCEDKETGNLEVEQVLPVPEKKQKERTSSRTQRVKDFKEDFPSVVPRGSLRVDELAKLLA
ncbi:hypothetical protein Nepgr_005164 [Nepenthes gracilis]|uniref:CRM domain-containing protein n=1 Tax=Nepenthes gracilis TaxID=150966 RepID=A0AAD3S2N0_NEPGR|nr:hypothetical protein Nepgr_005164 [Nepenthes gracilis]